MPTSSDLSTQERSLPWLESRACHDLPLRWPTFHGLCPCMGLLFSRNPGLAIFLTCAPQRAHPSVSHPHPPPRITVTGHPSSPMKEGACCAAYTESVQEMAFGGRWKAKDDFDKAERSRRSLELLLECLTWGLRLHLAVQEASIISVLVRRKHLGSAAPPCQGPC